MTKVSNLLIFRWFCHFDDDNYVNVPALIKMLRKYDHRSDWYLGKPSTTEPLKLSSSSNGGFWFGTGGAGFCLSSSLASKMAPKVAEGGLVGVCDRLRLPDDVAVGYVAGQLKELTVIPEFHSHLEPQRDLGGIADLERQISFSYSRWDSEKEFLNVLDLEGPWDLDQDPTRFYSLHCLLYPNVEWCNLGKKKKFKNKRKRIN